MLVGLAHISRVLLCHHSRKAGWEAGRELGKAGLLQGHASWEGPEGHVRTRKTGLVPICCGHRAVYALGTGSGQATGAVVRAV